MPIIRIEHPVADYESWKHAFDRDPLDRKGSGVTRYNVLRAADDANYVLIDLEIGTREQADRMMRALEEMWGRVQAQGMIGEKRARIVETVEEIEL
jgi:hypothetical protein